MPVLDGQLGNNDIFQKHVGLGDTKSRTEWVGFSESSISIEYHMDW